MRTLYAIASYSVSYSASYVELYIHASCDRPVDSILALYIGTKVSSKFESASIVSKFEIQKRLKYNTAY